MRARSLLPLPLLLAAAGCHASGHVQAGVYIAAPSAPAAGAGLVPFDCDEGTLVTLNGRNHCLYTTASTWDEAERRCVDHGGHLASLRDAGAREALFLALGSHVRAGSLWMGLFEPRSGEWSWANGGAAQFEAWAPGEPNNAGDEHCGEWLVTSGLWNDLNCGQQKPYLCQAKARSGFFSCAGGQGFVVGGFDYCVHESPATWQSAFAACAADGGQLARLETEADNTALQQAIGPRVPGSVWIGFTDRQKEGDFRWVGGQPAGETAWRGGEPNNAGDEDCTEWSPSDGLWNDLRCTARLASLCEEPPEGGLVQAQDTAPAAEIVDGDVAPILWLGMGKDRVGEWGSGSPDGKPDGLFRLRVPRDGVIASIEVQSADATGRPAGGQRWSTRDPNAWMAGVFESDGQLNRTHTDSLGLFPAGAVLVIHANDSGWFQPGNWFVVDVLWADGQGVRRLLQVP